MSSAEAVKLGNNLGKATLDVLFASVVVGFCGGLVGSGFILINNKVNILRKKHLTNKWLKVGECIIMAVATVSIMYSATYFKYSSDPSPNTNLNICQANSKVIGANLQLRQFLCPDLYFDRLATLFFDTQ